MKTTLEKGPHGGSDNALRQRNLTSTTVLVPMLNLSVANDLIQLAAVLALGPHRRDRTVGPLRVRAEAAEGAFRKSLPPADVS